MSQALGRLIDEHPEHREGLIRECAALDKQGKYWSNPTRFEMPEPVAPEDVRLRDTPVVIERTEEVNGYELRVVRVNPRAYYASEAGKAAYVREMRRRLMNGTASRVRVIRRVPESRGE